MSKIHGTSISNGSELEKIIEGKVENIPDLDDFLRKEIMPDGVLLATKKQIKECGSFDKSGVEPDFLIFKRRNGEQQKCYVIELKDGHAFDTKKAAKEIENLHTFISNNGSKIQYRFIGYIVSFNKDNKEEIVDGFKHKITMDEAMTGREFCELLEIDYDEIVETRKSDQEDNLKYFAEEIMEIPEIAKLLKW